MPKNLWAFGNSGIVAGTGMRAGATLLPAQPLHERVPTRDENGHYLSDFMMLFPGLRERTGSGRQETVGRINAVLIGFPEVVFADLNVHLNLLWVSVRARPGVILDIACCVKFHVPEALLVAPKYA